MNLTALLPGILFISMGVVLALLCYPLYRKDIKINRFYGFRFKRAFESPEAWAAINHYGAKQMAIWCPLMVAVGVLLILFPLEQKSLFLLLLVVMPILILVPAYQTYRFSKRFPN